MSDRRTAPEELAEFIDELHGNAGAIAHDLHARLLTEVPAYQRLAPNVLVPELAANIGLVLATGDTTSADMRPGIDSGAERARQGIDLADLLRGWRIGLEVTFEHAAEVAGRGAASDSLLIDFTRTMLHRADLAAAAVAKAHREAELASAVASARWRDRVLRAALLRDPDMPNAPDELAALGVPPEAETSAICAAHESDQATAQIARWLDRDGPHPPNGLITVVGRHLIGVALHLPSAPPPQLVALGPPGPPATLPDSLHVARRVLRTAGLVGRTGLCRTADLGILLPIVDDTDVGDALTARYIEPCASTAAGQDILRTVQAYLVRRQSVERAAADLFVHANTVRYRLQRFEHMTGADLRDPCSLSEIFWAIRRRQLSTSPIAAAAHPPETPLPPDPAM